MPAIIGDNAEMHWQGKYLTDDFGRIKYHDVVIREKDDEGNIIVEEHRAPANAQSQWDSTQEYIPGLKRPNGQRWSIGS